MFWNKLIQKKTKYDLVMTLLARDEEDVISENIEFHHAQGVDFFLATDNLSADSTSDILKDYERQGILKYIYRDEDVLNQGQWVTAMAREASERYGARWVINNDADEFWRPSEHASLREFLESLPRKINSVVAERLNFVPMQDSSAKFFDRMIFRDKVAKNVFGEHELPKVCHRGNPNVTVGEGNHKVAGFKRKEQQVGGIEVFHYPLRSYEQFERKTVNMARGLEKNKKLHPSVSKHARTLYKDYYLEGRLEEKYLECVCDTGKIEAGLASGELVKDVRLRDYFGWLTAAGRS